MITKYWVVIEVGHPKMMKTMEDLLKKGWQPIGGVSISDNGTFSQAVVTYENETSKIDELEKLISLKKSGNLSEEEFQAMKKQII